MTLDDRDGFAARRVAPAVFRLDETIKYDRELGEVQVLIDGVVRESMRVRTALVEGVLLEAIVAELERRGYTVTPPGATT